MKLPKITAQVSRELEPIADACQSYLTWLGTSDYNEDDISNYENAIVETTLKALYGDAAHKFINWQMCRKR